MSNDRNAAAPELLQLAYQYRDDLHHPPARDSVERRLKAIEAVISKATESAEIDALRSGQQFSLRDAAITFRCPDGFEALSEALGMADTEEDRSRLDDALKSVIQATA
ncbi:hypothetical protein ELI01_18890 [Rhizobium leguminosarum]|uniref:hypothetical protein n=1 Tax=Rhizobium leguminosarum TaxID=384 RepID=UPI001032728E|nr:hypothetical protein [Rhizobium leguminosarum]TAX57145.1 hypothetical protein ELI01_18890 [Rhizobium leguminosarum]